MLLRLLLILPIIPISELLVMIEVYRLVASRFGPGPGVLATLGEILLTGLLGAAIARNHGILALRGILQSLSENQVPDRPLINDALIVAGGILLLIPGYLTDLLGLTLILPGTHTLWRFALSRWFRTSLRAGTISVHGTPRPAAPDSARRAQSPTEGPQPGDVVIDVTPEDPS